MRLTVVADISCATVACGVVAEAAVDVLAPALDNVIVAVTRDRVVEVQATRLDTE